MSTDAQIAANQANSQHSTGPITEAGRAASSRNNFRHGFRSQCVLLPGDDPAEYDALLAELTAHFGPDDLTDERFVREMADADWRLRRVRQYLESAITRRIAALTPDHPDLDPIALQGLAIESLDQDGGPSYSTWLRYESKFERQYDRALKDWTRYQNDGRRARDKDADILMRETIFAPVPKPPARELASNVQNPVQTPRNAPCPCGSNEKYKRCCGKNAPPVLGNTLPHAA